METIVPSASAVSATSGGILKSVSTVVTEVLDNLDLYSPPAYTIALSTLEQANPRGWTRPVFFFETPKDVDPMHAVEIFRKGLEPTLKAIPSLACEIVPFEDGKKPSGKIALKHGNFGSLIVNDIRGTGLDYEELRLQNFPQSRLEPDVLCARGVFPASGEQTPAFIPQLNIIDGGFILALNTHHTTYDAQGINEILRVWAQNCHHLQNEAIRECRSLPVEHFDRAAHFASHAPTADKGLPEHHPEYLVAPEPITFGETAMKETHRTRVYRLSPKALAELKNDCTEAGESWISTNDAATALIWRSVLRAQVHPDQVPDDTISHHIVNVDLRLRSHPALSKSYVGCPMNYSRPGIKLREVYESTSLAPLARAIRSGVDSRDPDYVSSLVTMLENSPGYDHLISASFPNLMHIDCMTSTWYKLDIYDLNWGPALGHVERVRFPKRGLFNGLTMIYPQVTKGSVGMEIAIGLDKDNFEKLDADLVWCKYVERTDPGYDCL